MGYLTEVNQPEVNRPNLTEVNQPEVNQPNLTEVNQPNLTEDNQPEVNQPNLTEVYQPEVNLPNLAEVNQPEVDQPNLTEVNQPEVNQPDLLTAIAGRSEESKFRSVWKGWLNKMWNSWTSPVPNTSPQEQQEWLRQKKLAGRGGRRQEKKTSPNVYIIDIIRNILFKKIFDYIFL